MDDAKRESYARPIEDSAFVRVGGCGGCMEVCKTLWMERPSVQISVVVAIIEAKIFKVEVE